MKFNPYSAILVAAFIATVSISNYTIKNNKKIYEKTINDSCVCPNDSTRTLSKM